VAHLFTIETEQVLLNWTAPAETPAQVQAGVKAPPGRLLIRPRRVGLEFGSETRREGVPIGVAANPDETVGPRLFEQTNYTLYVRSKCDEEVSLETRDPVLLRGLSHSEHRRVIHGQLNFGSQVGTSEFLLRVGSQAEFDFTVEVFPSKLDYASDYLQLMAEVQDILTGLVLEYLRSAFRLGCSSRVARSTKLEWLTLLRHVALELDQAFTVITQSPLWLLKREPELTRAERVRPSDSSVRNAIVRGAGIGAQVQLATGLLVRRYVPSSKPCASLDTPEHRWLAAQLVAIRRQLASLREQERRRDETIRSPATISELDELVTLVSRLARTEPIAAATGAPQSGFASLALLKTPGYREAYRACLILSLGLRLEGGPVRLSVKDISLLYEYWCVLALLRLIAEETGHPIPTADIFAIEQQGLRVLLQRGQQQRIRFAASSSRRVSLIYNPQFGGQAVLTPQQPDVIVEIDDPDWPAVRLVLDAKYRLDSSVEYVHRYGSPGPPEDAINVLHRYRDAILDLEAGSQRPRRTVIQASALFPYREPQAGEFAISRQYEALQRLGVGALPFLPDQTDYVRDWLRSNLQSGSWSLADRAIPHRSQERSTRWRTAASEPVLIGVLHSGAEIAHLEWILQRRMYYVPLARTVREIRQYDTRFVALYSPSILRSPPAVTHVAEVHEVEVIRRAEIPTSWLATTDPDRLHILYHLGAMQLIEPPVANRGVERADRFSAPRWTTNLALRRAQVMRELLLETEPEWRLLEDLRAAQTPFHLRAGRRQLSTIDESRVGRAWFLVSGGRAQYRGAAGFVIQPYSGTEEYFPRSHEAARRLALLAEVGQAARG
jgi:hypothetical protein